MAIALSLVSLACSALALLVSGGNAVRIARLESATKAAPISIEVGSLSTANIDELLRRMATRLMAGDGHGLGR